MFFRKTLYIRNSSHESNSYNTNSIISIKGPSSEINYKDTGEYFLFKLLFRKALNHFKAHCLQCDLHICLSVLLTKSIFSVRGKYSLIMCLAPQSPTGVVLEPSMLLL